METTHNSKYKILVVDDNSENIRIIGSILRQNSYQVGFATGGQQTLDILGEKGEDYDLVLLDVNMPGLNGFEVCKKIREKSRLKDLPVIFLTANAEPEHIIEGFSSGGQDYVTKPFHAGELLSRIGTHLELKESREKLQQMNVILEEKVKERTRDLLEANKSLETANRQLRQLDEAKVNFLRLISHEINTPLNGLIGFAEILREQLISTEYFSLIEYLNESAHRLNEFAQLSLIITRMRTSPDQYPIELVDISETIHNTLEELSKAIHTKKTSVNVDYKTKNTKVSGNDQLIAVCISHIVKNAIQHNPEGEVINVNVYTENDRLLFTCIDNGPGFSDDALQNLFKPFSPGEKHVDQNKGLGLYVVKMIVDFHHAEISVSNRKGKGAKVSLAFNLLNLSN